MHSFGTLIMDDLATYLLDILQNSIRASAKNISMTININHMLEIIIKDDGKGIKKDHIELVTSPFYTTRTTRRVGLGLSLFKMLSEQTEGTFHIESTENIGTELRVTLDPNHIDMPPIGDIGEMIYMMTIHQDPYEFDFLYQQNQQSFNYKRSEIQALFNETIMDYQIMTGIKNWINHEIKNIRGEL